MWEWSPLGVPGFSASAALGVEPGASLQAVRYGVFAPKPRALPEGERPKEKSSPLDGSCLYFQYMGYGHLLRQVKGPLNVQVTAAWG